MSNAVLGDRHEQALRVLIEIGVFNNRSESLRAGVRALYLSLPEETRMQAGLHAYKALHVTLGRAAEIAHVTFDEMQERLQKEGILQEGREGANLKDRLERVGDLRETVKKSK